MKIQKKALAAIAEITNELGDQFDELRAEIDRRFGERRSEGEVFRPLPAPQGMDMSVLTALNERRSQRNFSNEPLPDQLLSNILYAADGINRKGGRRTTATALNWRETDIYVLKANGIWRWVPERNGVLFCSLHDVRDQTYLLQTQLTVPPVELVFVANYARTRNFLSNAVETIAPKIKKIVGILVAAIALLVGAKTCWRFIAIGALTAFAMLPLYGWFDELERDMAVKAVEKDYGIRVLQTNGGNGLAEVHYMFQQNPTCRSRYGLLWSWLGMVAERGRQEDCRTKAAGGKMIPSTVKATRFPAFFFNGVWQGLKTALVPHACISDPLPPMPTVRDWLQAHGGTGMDADAFDRCESE